MLIPPWAITAVLSLPAALAYAVLSSAVIPALPVIQHDLHTSETGVTWLLTGFLLSASVGTAIIGKLGDMYGKQRLLVWTLLDPGGRNAAGGRGRLAGRADRRPGHPGRGGRHLPARVRDHAGTSSRRSGLPGSIGLMSSILGIGGGGGLVLGGLIAEHLSWHWLFWVPLLPMVAAVVCTWRSSSPSRRSGRG